jgi:hypothetical protein
MSVAIAGELTPALSAPEMIERINRHFGVQTAGAAPVEEFPGDIPLHTESQRKPPQERVHP